MFSGYMHHDGRGDTREDLTMSADLNRHRLQRCLVGGVSLMIAALFAIFSIARHFSV
jgi:hypothetical protein